MKAPETPESKESKESRRSLTHGLLIFSIVEAAVIIVIIVAIWLFFRA